MPRFKVILDRTFIVTVKARNREDAKHAADEFVGYDDSSTPKYRRQYKFRIEDVEMMCNDAIECEEVK